MTIIDRRLAIRLLTTLRQRVTSSLYDDAVMFVRNIISSANTDPDQIRLLMNEIVGIAEAAAIHEYNNYVHTELIYQICLSMIDTTAEGSGITQNWYKLLDYVLQLGFKPRSVCMIRILICISYIAPALSSIIVQIATACPERKADLKICAYVLHCLQSLATATNTDIAEALYLSLDMQEYIYPELDLFREKKHGVMTYGVYHHDCLIQFIDWFKHLIDHRTASTVNRMVREMNHILICCIEPEKLRQ